ncbi:Inactive dipeptidyl peptidase 10 [Melipona quadrifasciata]|uniref:Inactive dipeptidyl peptidase 10 n=1 Tax=Melipona quadrifasciata TaxID=166423 RepID=A0A0M8ZQ89_9HYME|nr:Inactive dipeptidyl peptidase 10 [Melipona quadrifasciata]
MRAPTSLTGSYDTSVWGKESLSSAPPLMSLGKSSLTANDSISLQLATWAPRGNALVYVYQNNIYYRPEAEVAVDYQITDTGVFGTIYNGVPDWVYEASTPASYKLFPLPLATIMFKAVEKLLARLSSRSLTLYRRSSPVERVASQPLLSRINGASTRVAKAFCQPSDIWIIRLKLITLDLDVCQRWTTKSETFTKGRPCNAMEHCDTVRGRKEINPQSRSPFFEQLRELASLRVCGTPLGWVRNQPSRFSYNKRLGYGVAVISPTDDESRLGSDDSKTKRKTIAFSLPLLSEILSIRPSTTSFTPSQLSSLYYVMIETTKLRRTSRSVNVCPVQNKGPSTTAHFQQKGKAKEDNTPRVSRFRIANRNGESDPVQNIIVSALNNQQQPVARC